MTVIEEVAAERQRQIEQEGWTPSHDDEHSYGEMADAGACYALLGGGNAPWRHSVVRRAWPWTWEWLKPKDHRRNLIRAAALIVAEIERLDRAAER